MSKLICIVTVATALSGCATDTIEDRRSGQTIVCHDGHKTLTLSNASAIDHMQHGDQPGPCPQDG